MPMNSHIRITSSTSQAQHPRTLRAIAEKTDELTSHLTVLAAESERVSALIQQIPDDVSSRLAWLNNNLCQMDLSSDL